MLFKKRKGRRGSRNKKGVEEKVIKRKKRNKKEKNIYRRGNGRIRKVGIRNYIQ